jgi:N-acetylglucosamine kinase-like BadF-type ATPase
LRTLLKGIDGRRKRSEGLEHKVLGFIGLSSIEDIITWYYSVRQTVKWRSDIADLCIPLILAAEKQGDQLAKELVQQEAFLLLESLKVAIRRAELCKDKFYPLPINLILEGGLFRHSRLYRDTFISWFPSQTESVLPCQPVWPEYQPVVGAIALAMSENCYIKEDEKRFDELRKSAKQVGLKVGDRPYDSEEF